MRLCMPTLDDAGLAGRLASHFGSAPYYTYVEMDSGTLEVEANAGARHQHGSCDAAAGMTGRRVDAVVCRGLGRRAFAGLAAAGISVYLSDAEGVAAAVEGFRAGRLAQMTEEGACRGGHGHAAHGDGGCGHGAHGA